MYTTEIAVASCGSDVTCPLFHDNQLYVVLGNAGAVMRVKEE
jgi:hypothetical protein